MVDGVVKDYTGKVVGKLTFTCFSHTNNRKSYWILTCVCGKEVIKRADTRGGENLNCGDCNNRVSFVKDKVLVDVSTENIPNTHTLIDREDYEKVRKVRWYAVISGDYRKPYVEGYMDGNTVKLHRVLSNCPKGFIVDHNDGDTLNNCKDNLNIGDKQLNSRNCHRFITNSSGCCGVSKSKSGNFRAYITLNGVQKSLGTYPDYFEACCVRKSAEVLLSFNRNHGRA